MHAAKVRKNKDKSIAITYFETDITPILGGLNEVNESKTTLIVIIIPELWNAHDGFRGV